MNNLNEAYNALKSSNPKIRMDAAMMAVEKKFWFSEPPGWFTVSKYPDVIGFDNKFVIYGTNYKNIKLITWEELESGSFFHEEFIDFIAKKVA